MFLTRITALLAVAFVVVWSTPGMTEDTAETHYFQALELFNQGRYIDALEQFDRAIALRPEPVFYCNRAAVLLQLGQTRDALESMQVCRTGFEDADIEERAQVDAEVLALELAVKFVVPNTRAVASAIAFAPVAKTEPPPEVIVVAARDEGLDGVEFAAWGVGSVGALCLATALVLDLVTAPLIEEYRTVGSDGEDRASFDALRRAIDQRQVLIGSLLIGGVLSALTSGALFWWGHDSPAADPMPAEFLIHGNGVTFQWGFSY